MKKRLVTIAVALMMVLMTALTAYAAEEMTADKLDTYYASGRLTKEQYEELMGMVNPQPAANESEGE